MPKFLVRTVPSSEESTNGAKYIEFLTVRVTIAASVHPGG